MQSKKMSAFESVLNAVIGIVFSIVIQILVYGILSIKVTFAENLFITLVFFLSSFVRSFIIRRVFNSIK